MSAGNERGFSLKSRPILPVAIAIVAILVISGLGSWLGLFPRALSLGPQLGSTAAVPEAAMFVPRQAAAMVSLLGNPAPIAAQLQHLTSTKPTQAHEGIQRLQQALLGDASLDYERLIQPWLGEEVTLAVTTLDLDRNARNGLQPGYLLAIAAQDPAQTQTFLTQYWQRYSQRPGVSPESVSTEIYQGIPLTYAASAAASAIPAGDRSNLPWASALIGDRFLLFANQPKVLREAVNNVQVPELNLAHSSRYQSGVAALTQPRVGLAFLNLDALRPWLATQGIQIGSPSPQGTAIAPAASSSLTVGMGLKPQAFLADLALQSPLTLMPQGSDRSGAEALHYLPRLTTVAAAGLDLNALWQAVGNPNRQTLQQFLPRLTSLTQDWGLDIAQTVLPWVQSEYAIAQVMRTQGKTMVRDGVFIVNRSSPEARSGIAQLDDIAEQQGYSLSTLSLGSQEVLAWTQIRPTATGSVETLVRGVHTGISNYEVFTTSLETMEAIVQSLKAGETLETTKPFQSAIAQLPSGEQGYLYLDWPATRTSLERQLPWLRLIELAGESVIEQVQTLVLGSYGQFEVTLGDNSPSATTPSNAIPPRAIQRAALAIQFKPK